jgi:hypothetical protein
MVNAVSWNTLGTVEQTGDVFTPLIVLDESNDLIALRGALRGVDDVDYNRVRQELDL